MAYGTDAIAIRYQSQGDSLLPDTQNVLVLGVRDGHLVDETAAYQSDPARYMKFIDSDLDLELSAHEVGIGEKYTLSIPSLSNVPVRIAYTLNESRPRIFETALNADGRVSFEVSSYTERGVYRFWAFNVSGTPDWIRADRSLTVR
jgi:hypothetical protein